MLSSKVGALSDKHYYTSWTYNFFQWYFQISILGQLGISYTVLKESQRTQHVSLPKEGNILSTVYVSNAECNVGAESILPNGGIAFFIDPKSASLE